MLGGVCGIKKLRRHPVLTAIAARHDISPETVALAWLYDLHPLVVPIPGATRIATAAAAPDVLTLTADERAELDAAFVSGARLRAPLDQRAPRPDADGEVVLLMGIQGAGKSTAVTAWTERGYGRLNRDLAGGTLAGLLPKLDRALAAGERRWVMDNTYGTRVARGRVVDVAWRHGVPVRCVWMETPLPQAQQNAVLRLIERYDQLPDPEELKRLAKTDPSAFAPNAQFRYERFFEAPQADEGFSAVDLRPFERRPTSPDARIASRMRFRHSVEWDAVVGTAHP